MFTVDFSLTGLLLNISRLVMRQVVSVVKSEERSGRIGMCLRAVRNSNVALSFLDDDGFKWLGDNICYPTQ